MKLKKISRVIAMGCAASLALAGSAAAAGRPSTISDVSADTNFEYASSTETGTIRLTMSTSGNVYVNPYNLDMIVFGDDVKANDGVISPTQFIKNESNVGIKVGITPSAGVSRSMTLMKKADVASADKKAIGAEFQLVGVDDDQADATWDGVTGIDIFEKNKTLTDTGVTLARGDSAATYAAFRVVGDTKTPAGTTWSDSDSLTLSVAFSFTPVAGTNGGSGTVTPDPTAPAITVTADKASYDPNTNYQGTLTLNYTNVDAGDEGNWTITWPTTDSNCKFTPSRSNVKQCAIEIDQNATAGDYDYTITATDGTDTVTTKVTLKVTA